MGNHGLSHSLIFFCHLVSSKIGDPYRPHWDMFPWWTERFYFGLSSVSILKSPWCALSIYSNPPTEQKLRYMENYLYLCFRCRNSWNLMEHSVPLTGFQNGSRRTSNHLSYLLGLLEVKQSLANLCFIFDLQSPHHNTWEHWEWNFLLPSQIVFWIILYCLLKLLLILPQDRKETWISLNEKLSSNPYPSCYPTVCAKTLVT